MANLKRDCWSYVICSLLALIENPFVIMSEWTKNEEIYNILKTKYALLFTLFGSDHIQMLASSNFP